MPCDTRHPSAIAAAPAWEIIRDCLAGERRIKERGECYLPKLFAQEPKDYAAYKGRAVWMGATSSTHKGYIGMVCRKPPETKVPDSLKTWLDNVDGQGTPFTAFAQGVIDELSSLGWGGTLVDWTEDSTPYYTNYAAECIWNWKPRRIEGRNMLSMLVLREQSLEWREETGYDRPDEYCQDTYEQYREFHLRGDKLAELAVEMIVKRPKGPKLLAAAAAAGHTTPIANKASGDNGREFVEIERSVLSLRGYPIREIPFIPHTCDNTDPFVIPKPFLEDLASINVKHYAQSADLENGRHVAGLPTPYAICFDEPEGTTLTLGSSAAWSTQNENASCGFLEFTGAGLSELRLGVEEKQKQMAALGARAFTPEKSDAEAYQTHELRARGEGAKLVTLAEMASRSLSLCLSWALYITTGTASTKREDLEKLAFTVVNKDLTSTTATPEQITAFVSALQSNAISFETFFHNMRSREMYNDGRTMEQEQEAIQQGPPAPPVPVIADQFGNQLPPGSPLPKPDPKPPAK